MEKMELYVFTDRGSLSSRAFVSKDECIDFLNKRYGNGFPYENPGCIEEQQECIDFMGGLSDLEVGGRLIFDDVDMNEILYKVSTK